MVLQQLIQKIVIIGGVYLLGVMNIDDFELEMSLGPLGRTMLFSHWPGNPLVGQSDSFIGRVSPLVGQWDFFIGRVNALAGQWDPPINQPDPQPLQIQTKKQQLKSIQLLVS